MRFSRQGYWIVLPFPSPGDLPNPEIEPRSPALQADPLLTELQGKEEPEVKSYSQPLTQVPTQSLGLSPTSIGEGEANAEKNPTRNC